MKTILILICSLSTIHGYGQNTLTLTSFSKSEAPLFKNSGKTTIPHFEKDNSNLDWSHWKADAPDSEQNVLARTMSTMDMQTIERGGKIYFTVTGGMIQNESWTRTHEKRILLHENTHRKIAIVMAALCQQEINSSGIQGKYDQHSIDLAHEKFEYWYTRMTKAQDEFDLNSEHGNMPLMEKFWEELTNEQLQKLKK